MHRPGLVIFFAAIVGSMVALERPAQAGITSVTIDTPQTTNLPCPTSIPITAFVQGSAGPFQATLQTNFNGIPTSTGTVTGTLMPLNPGNPVGSASGTLTVPITSSGLITYTASQNGVAYPPATIRVMCQPPPSSWTITNFQLRPVTDPSQPINTNQLPCPTQLTLVATGVGLPGKSYDYLHLTDFEGVVAQTPTQQLTLPTGGLLPGALDQQFTITVPPYTGPGSYAEFAIAAVGGNTQELQLPLACAPPAMKSIQLLPSTGAWRPNPDFHYAGQDDLKALVTMQLPGQPQSPPLCSFAVQVRDILGNVVDTVNAGPNNASAAAGTLSNGTYTYGVTVDLGKVQGSGGAYFLNAGPTRPLSSTTVLACGGGASATIGLLPNTPWVMGFNLLGMGVAVRDGVGQNYPRNFCSACEFGAGTHDDAFLAFQPQMESSALLATDPTVANECVYRVVYNGGSFDGNNTFNLGEPGVQIVYVKGQPGTPPSQQSYNPNIANPWWTQWANSTDTTQVTVENGTDPNIPNCNIVGGSGITKQLKITNTPGAIFSNTGTSYAQ